MWSTAETLQQTQTLSLRVSETLRKRLEDIRKLTALRKGESITTSEIAKQLLESARGDRFETVELLSKPLEAVLEIRRKGEARHILSRAEWTVLAYYVQQGSEAFPKNPLSRETLHRHPQGFRSRPRASPQTFRQRRRLSGEPANRLPAGTEAV